VTLLIDYFRTDDFSKSGSGLTGKQRSLVIVVMILLAYLGFGAIVYCFMLNLTFLDALYFAVCSSLTIGFGDITPTTTGSRVVSVFYNTFGILNTGLAIAIARETIVESFEGVVRRKLPRQGDAKRALTPTFSTRSESIPVTEALEGQDETSETDDQVTKVDNNMVSEFEDEECEHNQFCQDMIKEEPKEFNAKVCISCRD
jgi:hypothetical protein